MRLRTKLAALTVTAGVALAATGAYAYWSTAGGGSGSATAASGFANPIVVNQVGAPSGLVPGGDPGALSGNFTNSNSGSVSVGGVTATVTGTHLTGQAANTNTGCDAADFGPITIVVDTALVNPGAPNGAWHGSISLLDRPTVDQNACKNAIVDISYVSS